MSKLKRTLSMRRKSYKTLDSAKELDFFSTPPHKLTPVSELGRHQGTYKKITNESSVIPSTSTPQSHMITNKENKQQSTSKFLRLTAVKNAISNIGDKLRVEKKVKRKALRNSPYQTNEAYTTPRRSQRIAIKNTNTSPVISMEMYSPFWIEAPDTLADTEEGFTNNRESQKRKDSKCQKSPGSPKAGGTPRANKLKQALKEHKKLANSLSSSTLPTASGY